MTIKIDRAVLEQAVDALHHASLYWPHPRVNAAFEALSEAIKPPQSYVVQVTMMSNDRMQIDPVSGNVNIAAREVK